MTLPSPSSLPSELCGFPIQNKLGEGSYGAVYSVSWPKNTSKGKLSLAQIGQEEVVLKRIKKADKDYNSDIIIEIDLLSRINHKFCMFSKSIDIDTNGGICIIMEKMDIDLHNFLQKFKLDTKQKYTLCYNLTEGLNYLHFNKIIHRDLHSGNVLIDTKTLLPKITDYGLSKIYDYLPYYNEEILVASNRPPEFLILNLNNIAPQPNSIITYGPEIDVWCLGLLVYLIFSGRNLLSSTWNIELLLIEIYVLIGSTDEQSHILNKYIHAHKLITQDKLQQYWDEQDKIFNRIDFDDIQKEQLLTNFKYIFPDVEEYLNSLHNKYNKFDKIQQRQLLLTDLNRLNLLFNINFREDLIKRRYEIFNEINKKFFKLFLNPNPNERLNTTQILKMFPEPYSSVIPSKIFYPVYYLEYKFHYTKDIRKKLINEVLNIYNNKLINFPVLIQCIDIMDRFFGNLTYVDRIEFNEMPIYMLACLNLAALLLLEKKIHIKNYLDFLKYYNIITDENRFLDIQIKIIKKLNFYLYRPIIEFLLTTMDQTAIIGYCLENLLPGNINK